MNIKAEQLAMEFNDVGRVVEVFRGVSLDVPSGSSLAIIGESGVGKTTLLYILGGLEKPSSGTVYIGDQNLSTLAAKPDELTRFRGRYVGFVFQFHYLLPEFDALENVAMPLIIRGESRATAFARARSLLERTGLGHRLEHRPGALSGGEQQRVAIARAFAGSPGLVLADEPTGNLDVRTAGEVNKLLRQLQAEEGTTLVVVTHSLELAASMDVVQELTPLGLERSALTRKSTA